MSVEVFAVVQVLKKFSESVVVEVTWSKPDLKETAGPIEIKFSDLGQAVQFLIEDLRIPLDVFQCEELENLERVRQQVDFEASEPLVDFLHSSLKLEDGEFWSSYKIASIHYKQLDLSVADNVLDF